jgi:hypothetical protein
MIYFLYTDLFGLASQNRSAKSFQFTLTEENRKTLAMGTAGDDKPAHQIRFCCAAYTSEDDIPEEGLLMEFPAICELKVNDNVVSGPVSVLYGFA